MLYGEYTSAGALVREYVYLNGQPLAQVDAGSPEVLTYIHTDHLGTPRFGTNTGGTQVWAWSSDAFGVGAPSGSRTVNLRMAGQYYDSESGLFYNWNRYYNPNIGRYVSSDPIGLKGGLNPFSYAEASPVMYSDPEGLYSSDPWLPPVIETIGVGVGAGVKAAAGGIGVVIGVCTPMRELGSDDTCIDPKTCPNPKNKEDKEEDACPPCNPPAGVKFNFVTHYESHSKAEGGEKGSHGCEEKTGSPVHWHYSVNNQNPKTCQCFLRGHVFGGCGVAPGQ